MAKSVARYLASAAIAAVVTTGANAQVGLSTVPQMATPEVQLASFAVEQSSDQSQASNDVVVTARRRSEALKDVPAAITAFGADQIARAKIRGVDDLAAYTPGLQTSDASVSSGGSISLRGIGSGSTNYLGDQAVSINVDGMQVGTLNIRKTAQIDLEQIEILRGPQALFFGKNSPGGVISLKSADPTSTTFLEAEASIEGVSGDKYVQAIASGPISDSLGLRLVARYTDLEGYFRLKTVPSNGDPLVVPPAVDKYPIGHETFVRGTVAWEPSDIFKLKSKLSYTETYNRGGSITAAQRFNCPFGAPQLQPNFPCVGDRDIYRGSASVSLTSLIPGSPPIDGLGLRRNEQYLATTEANLRLTPDIVATSVTGYYYFDELNAHDASIGPRSILLVPYLPFTMSQWTQELRVISSFSSPLNFTVGAFYENRYTEGAQNAVIALTTPPTLLRTEATFQKNETVSIFGQLLWKPIMSLELSGGLRFTSENKALRYTYAGADITNLLARRNLDFSNVSPEFTASYHVNPNLMLFGSYKKGFKSGGFDAGFTSGAIARAAPGAFRNTYNEENVSGFEGGAKWGSRKLTFNLTGYRYDYKDLQVGAYDATTISFKVLNAAAARIQGLELDSNWRTPLSGFSIHAAAGLNDAKFRKFLSGCYVGQTPALGCNLTPNAAGVFQEQNLASKQINNAPRFSGTVGALYETAVTDRIGLELSTDVNYSSSYFANLRQSPQDLQHSFGKLDASIRLFDNDRAWSVSVIGRNLTDRYTFNGSNAITLTGAGSGTSTARLADESAYFSRGREVFLTLTLRPSAMR